MALFCFYGLRSYLPGAAFETRGWGRKGEKERERERERESYIPYILDRRLIGRRPIIILMEYRVVYFAGLLVFGFFFLISPFLLFNPFQGRKMMGEEG